LNIFSGSKIIAVCLSTLPPGDILAFDADYVSRRNFTILLINVNHITGFVDQETDLVGIIGRRF
jgi:hypothetical protein